MDPYRSDTNFCSYCKEGGETTPATVWCSDCDDALCERCARGHKRAAPCPWKHDVIGLSEEAKVKRECKVTCKKHTDEKVELLCKDCKMWRDAAKWKSKLTEVTQSCKQTELDIKSESQKLRDVIHFQENKLLDELESVADKELGHLKADIKTGETTIQMYQQQSELIDHVMNSDCEMDIYEMYRSCESGTTESEDDGNIDLNKGTLGRINLRTNTDQLTEAINDLQLGEIEVMYESGMDLKRTPVLQDTIAVHGMDLKRTPVLQDIIALRVAGDQSTAHSVDVKVLDVNGINTVVVTDWNRNKSVKSFYSRNSQPCHSKLSLDSGPWGLTQLKRDQVAVTVPYAKQIVTVEVNPDLKLLSTITTQKRYWGIAALTPSTIAVGSRDTPSVDILNMTGTVIRSLTPSVNNKSLLRNPYFLCTTKNGNFLVSDDCTMSVLCLTPQGDVVFNYSPTTGLNWPLGITATNTGDILVADGSRNAVLHLTESGQFVRNILTRADGLSSPYGLSLDKHGRLYVSQYDRDVKVFKG